MMSGPSPSGPWASGEPMGQPLRMCTAMSVKCVCYSGTSPLELERHCQKLSKLLTLGSLVHLIPISSNFCASTSLCLQNSRRHHHQLWHSCGQPAASCDRGRSEQGAHGGPDCRPAGGAAWHRRQPDHRPGKPAVLCRLDPAVLCRLRLAVCSAQALKAWV